MRKFACEGLGRGRMWHELVHAIIVNHIECNTVEQIRHSMYRTASLVLLGCCTRLRLRCPTSTAIAVVVEPCTDFAGIRRDRLWWIPR
jgi:hypothetical protein